LGWARANILYDRVDGMPDPGSPMEILYMVLWRMRQQIDFHKSRALMQALMSQQGVNAEHIEKAFEDLRNSFFPFEQHQKEEEVESLKKIMFKEIARGALSVTPMVDMTRTRVKQDIARGQANIREKADMLRSGRLKPLDQDLLKKARSRDRVSLIGRDNARRIVRHTTKAGTPGRA
jgi:hypothetical protein